MIHFGSCAVWITGEARDCDCCADRGWTIRKDPTLNVHQWRIYRRVHDGDLVPLMGAATFEAAVKIVAALMKLRMTAIKGDRHVW